MRARIGEAEAPTFVKANKVWTQFHLSMWEKDALGLCEVSNILCKTWNWSSVMDVHRSYPQSLVISISGVAFIT
jgi:hypothetical protein